MQQLDQWHDAQLQAGQNRLQVEQQYHQQLMQMKQQEDTNRNSIAADQSRLGVIRQRLAQIDTDNPKTEADKLLKAAERTRLYNESVEIQNRMRGVTSPPNGAGSGGGGATGSPATSTQPFRPAPTTQPTPGQVPAGQPAPAAQAGQPAMMEHQQVMVPKAGQPAPATAPANSLEADYQTAVAASHNPYPSARQAEAISSLMQKGYTTAPNGEPLVAVKQKLLKMVPIEQAMSVQKELSKEQLLELVASLGGNAGAAAQYLRQYGYDTYGRFTNNISSGGR